MAINGVSKTTVSLIEKLKGGYSSKNTEPKTQSLQAVQGSLNKKSYGTMARDALEKYLKRDGYKYNVNTDKLYSQYADRYKKEGERAMRDTVANASSLTGGRGNSYAVNAGYSAYQSYLDKLNDIIPELEDKAYERYLDEGKEAVDVLDMILSLDENEYRKRRDDIEDSFTKRELDEEAYRYRENADMEMYKTLVDYVLELAKLENDNYFNKKDSDLAREKEKNDYYLSLLKNK
ncbi:MAG: hypothetical protein E7652_04705 [Ruminococcaceae bacterium]|nr:hypothetical protein [Oscillospiraceae bacterium]